MFASLSASEGFGYQLNPQPAHRLDSIPAHLSPHLAQPRRSPNGRPQRHRGSGRCDVPGYHLQASCEKSSHPQRQLDSRLVRSRCGLSSHASPYRVRRRARHADSLIDYARVSRIHPRKASLSSSPNEKTTAGLLTGCVPPRLFPPGTQPGRQPASRQHASSRPDWIPTSTPRARLTPSMGRYGPRVSRMRRSSRSAGSSASARLPFDATFTALAPQLLHEAGTNPSQQRTPKKTASPQGLKTMAHSCMPRSSIWVKRNNCAGVKVSKRFHRDQPG